MQVFKTNYGSLDKVPILLSSIEVAFMESSAHDQLYENANYTIVYLTPQLFNRPKCSGSEYPDEKSFGRVGFN